jgi:hypothetical protein
MQLAHVDLLSEDPAARPEESLSPRARRRGRERQLEQLREAVDSLLAARSAAATPGGPAGSSGATDGGRGAGEAGGLHEGAAEPPEEFLDPILMTLMTVSWADSPAELAALLS